MKEIEVDGVGVMRHLNEWQQERLFRMPRGQNRVLAPAAFGLGMTIQQFKKLTVDQQKAALQASNRLTAPPPQKGMDQILSARNRLPQAWERVSEERQIELGKMLLAKKDKLPHGHFRRWVEECGGITLSQAAKWMRKAKIDDRDGHFL